jgi:hypothetical protein
MTDLQQPSDTARSIDALEELVAALDRRVRHVERSGEHAIALEAANLRAEALRRIDEIRRGTSDRLARDAALPGQVMSDDGGTVVPE